ncbi:MAG: hypothetical protein ABGZ08_13525 [Akkermansiaceae bacterium]
MSLTAENRRDGLVVPLVTTAGTLGASDSSPGVRLQAILQAMSATGWSDRPGNPAVGARHNPEIGSH